MPKKAQRSLWFDQPITDKDVMGIWDNPETWLSRKQIAERLDRVKSPSLLARIETLANQGRLERTHITRPNGAIMYLYRPAAQRTETGQ